MELTDEQQAIRHEIQHGTEHVLIDALAGCAKTTTLLNGLSVIPQRSILFAAFNRNIADEAARRIPKMRPGWIVVVQTFHALGREILKRHFPRLVIDRKATEDLINEACLTVWPDAPYEARSSAMRIVRFTKESLEPIPAAADGGCSWPVDRLVAVGLAQQLISHRLKGERIERSGRIAHRAIEISADVQRRQSVDFCDLTWLPSVLELAPASRYQAIMLDELQDISIPQAHLISRVSLPNTRVIAAGDARQQLYSWRGSMGADAFERYMPKSGKRFPLTMTWRCSTRVVQAAQQLVPELHAQPNAEEGSVSSCTLGELPLRVAQGLTPNGVHTFILSRTNRALLNCALFLWRSGTKFMLNAGSDLLEPLFQVIDHELDGRSATAFRQSLDAWHKREIDKADRAGATTMRERVDEQRAMLLSALLYAPPSQIRRLLSSILQPNKSGVLLSTVHKVKGLEADRVFLLRQTFARQEQLWLAERIQDDDPGFGDADEAALHQATRPLHPEELNIEYVAITRARSHLVWVDIQSKNRSALLTKPINEIALEDLDDAFGLHERAMQQAEEAGDLDAATRYSNRLAELLRRTR